jgi:hypothetical protein
MTFWEYHIVQIRYDDKKAKDWVSVDQSPQSGLENILRIAGKHGWELVSLIPQQEQAYPGFGKYIIEPLMFMATFKRPAGG